MRVHDQLVAGAGARSRVRCCIGVDGDVRDVRLHRRSRSAPRTRRRPGRSSRRGSGGCSARSSRPGTGWGSTGASRPAARSPSRRAGGAGASAVTSSLGASGSLIPSDLRIRLPYVHRDDVEQPVVLLAQEPRRRPAPPARRRRDAPRPARRTLPGSRALRALAGTGWHRSPTRKHLPGQRLQLGDQVVGRHHEVVGLPDHPAGHGPVDGGEHLAALRASITAAIRPRREPDRVREGVEARDADDRDAQ